MEKTETDLLDGVDTSKSYDDVSVTGSWSEWTTVVGHLFIALSHPSVGSTPRGMGRKMLDRFARRLVTETWLPDSADTAQVCDQLSVSGNCMEWMAVVGYLSLALLSAGNAPGTGQDMSDRILQQLVNQGFITLARADQLRYRHGGFNG